MNHAKIKNIDNVITKNSTNTRIRKTGKHTEKNTCNFLFVYKRWQVHNVFYTHSQHETKF